MKANVQESKAVLNTLLALIKNHPMCGRFEASKGLYRVLYPYGSGLSGVQAHVGTSKSEALQRVLAAMERHWNERV